MSVYQKKSSGKWIAEIWFNSKRHSCKSFSKKALAEKYERDQLAQLEAIQVTGIKVINHTYNEIFGFWYTNALSRKRHTSLVKDLQMHREFISPIIGVLKMSEISPIHFEEIVGRMLSRGLSKASVNKVIQHFKAVFNHSYSNETIGRNPSKSFKTLRLDSKEMDYLSQEEMETLLSFTSQRYVGEERWKHVLYLTLFTTGMRLGEVLGLQWQRIQFDKNLIIIGQIWSAPENELIYTTKGKKDRVIPLPSELKRELGAIKNFSKSSFLFSDVREAPIDPSNFRNRNWDKDLQSSGIRQIRIHDARHTYASLFMMNGGSLYDLKEVLGHSTIKTTERYAHLSNTHLANVRDIIKPNIQKRAEVFSVDEYQKNAQSRLNHVREKERSEFVM
jgi:site-specific recombinase XerD